MAARILVGALLMAAGGWLFSCSTQDGEEAGGGDKPGAAYSWTTGQEVVGLADGRFALAGQEQFVLDADSGQSDFDMMLRFLGGDYQAQSDKLLGGPGYDRISSLTPTADGGLLVCGVRGGDPEEMGSHADAAMYRLGPTGEILIERYIGWEGSDNCLAVREADGGYQMLFVTSGSQEAGRLEGLYLLTLDAVGAVIGDEYKAADSGVTYRAAGFTADGGWILVGVHSYGGSKEVLVLQRVDGEGKGMFDIRPSDRSFFTSVNGIVDAGDGGIVFTGGMRAELVDDKPPMFIERLDAAGKTVWFQKYVEEVFATGYSLIRTADGGYLAGGQGYYADNEGLLVKVDSGGAQLWTARVVRGETTFIHDLLETKAGVLLVGTTWSPENGIRLWAELKTEFP